MEDVRRTMKEATDYVSQAKKVHSAAEYRMRQAEKALGTVNNKMESTVQKLEKTAQDAVQVSINLVSLLLVRSSVFG
jgi:methyl-accepting chemotaxis protein